MTLRATAVLVTALLSLLVASCSADGTAGAGGSGTDRSGASLQHGGVDVDTPQLRRLKEQAGIDACPETAPQPASVGDGLPDLVLPCLGGGRPVRLSAIRGPAVVNLWAQWCAPCRAELPHYQELHEKAGDKLLVLGVDWRDTQPQRALGLLRETGVTYPQVADPEGRTEGPLRVRGLPGVVFVDARGHASRVTFTSIDSYDQLRRMVHSHLGITLP